MKSNDIEPPEGGETVTVEVPKSAARTLETLIEWREDDTGDELSRGGMVYVAAKFLRDCNPDADSQLIGKFSASDVITIQMALSDSLEDLDEEIDDASDLIVDNLKGRRRRMAGTLKSVERQGYEDSATFDEDSVMYEYEP